MSASADSETIYHNHRDQQIDNILNSAQSLFNAKGIETVTMANIAKNARISRNTLYNYFPNKQEVAYGIFQRIIDHHSQRFPLEEVGEGTGYTQLVKFMMGMIQMIEDYPEDSRFIAEFNVLYAREGDPQRMRQMYAGGDNLMFSIIQQGISDGSLRTDLEPGLLFAVIYNLLSAINLRFSLTGSLIGEEYGQPVHEIFQSIFNIFLQGLQSGKEL